VRVLAGESEAAPVASDAPAADRDEMAAGLPERIGAFEIIEELGRGGMARVFAARQIGLGRIVAVKAIAAGQGRVVDLELRFLREVQTVARLRHPHIVTVHDSGRAHGYVYFSMDYLEDGDLARRIKVRPPAPREAAELLRKVALALAYTHGEGVLHRDLKPSNILLEGDEPRVADFGLAAQLEAGGDLTAATGVLGTPHYVAPEALRGGSAALTVASDLYALGVILFELLTGRTPFAGASPAGLAALVETAEPPAPHLLAPAVPRDLETICLTCLEREPARRYATAADLAEDLRRFLADEPIVARRPGAWERWRKFSRRHRAGVAAAGAVVGVLLAATAVGAAVAVQARRAERAAAREARTSRELADFLRHDLLAQASPEQQPDRDLKLRTVLDRAARRIEGRFGDQPPVEATLRTTLAETYEALGEYAASVPHLERALELRREHLGPDAPDTWRVKAALTMALYHLARYKEAETLGAEVLAWRRRTLGAEHPDALASASTLALVHQSAGKLAEAEALYRETLEARRRVLGAEHPDTLETATGLGVVLRLRTRLPEAETLLRDVVEARRRTGTGDHPSAMRSINELAGVVVTAGKPAEGEALFRESLALARRVMGPESADALTILGNLGMTLQTQGKYAEAQPVLDEAVALQRRIRGPEHPNTLNVMVTRALNLTYREEFAAAEAAQEELLPLLRRVLGPDHTFTLGGMVNRASNYESAGRYEEAQHVIEETLVAARRAFGPDHLVTLAALNIAGSIARGRGNLEEARALHAEAWERRRRLIGEEHPSTLVSRYQLAIDELALGREEAALAGHDAVLAVRRRKLGDANPATLLSAEAVADLRMRRGEAAAAETLWREVWAHRLKVAPEHWRTAAVQSRLGEAVASQRRWAEAEPLLLAGYAALRERAEKIPPPSAKAPAEAAARLAALYSAWGRSAEATQWAATASAANR